MILYKVGIFSRNVKKKKFKQAPQNLKSISKSVLKIEVF